MHCQESADHVNEDKALKCFMETRNYLPHLARHYYDAKHAMIQTKGMQKNNCLTKKRSLLGLNSEDEKDLIGL
jgi:hypothetical protein